MLSKVSLLTALSFAAIYPLCFWISAKDPLKNNFHKFHIGLPNVIGGITLVFILLMPIPMEIKIWAIVWKLTFLAASQFSWRKASPNPIVMTIPCILGLIAFVKLQAHLINPAWQTAVIGILSGFIYCSSLFAMNLGHWYLNVHGLPIVHLQRANNVFGFFLLLRIIWDITMLMFSQTFYNGELVPLMHFALRLDGFFIFIAIFFGSLFPFGSLFFTKETLRLKNTQSTTGIL